MKIRLILDQDMSTATINPAFQTRRGEKNCPKYQELKIADSKRLKGSPREMVEKTKFELAGYNCTATVSCFPIVL